MLTDQDGDCHHDLKNMRQNKRNTGTLYEQATGYYLEQQGYIVLEYNYRCSFGEIDLIAKDGEYLVFCEVKFRRNRRKGSPLEAVDIRKQRTIYRCAQCYLTERHVPECACRFDVIGVEGDRITLIKNAFEA